MEDGKEAYCFLRPDWMQRTGILDDKAPGVMIDERCRTRLSNERIDDNGNQM